MKQSDAIRQLYAVLPKVTALFSDTVSATLTFNAGVVTATTSSAHGRSTNDVVSVSGAYYKNSVASITRVGQVATVTTAAPHDLTTGWSTSVLISGAAQAEYNGTKTVLAILSDNVFTVSVSGSPVTPATGTIFLNENRRETFNGRHQITVTGANTFTYPVTTSLSSAAGGTPLVHTNIRVSGSASVDRILEAYTKQSTEKLWAFVVLDGATVSRDRATRNDALVSYTGTEGIRVREIENFSVYVVSASTNSLAGRYESDLMEDVKVALFKSLVGARLESALSDVRASIVTPVGDDFFAYTGTYYVHRFMFQTYRDIVTEDAVEREDTVAFKEIDLGFINEFENVTMSAEIFLDEE